MRTLLIAGLIGLAAEAHGQCLADFDRSGAVEINELIAAVGEALGGCSSVGTATPTRRQPTPTRTPTSTRTPTNPPAGQCPYRFNQDVDPDSFCRYSGQLSSTRCDSFPILSGWTTVDTNVIGLLIDNSGTIGVFGVRTSPTRATIDSVAFGPDFSDFYSATGTLSIPTNRRLDVTTAFGSECGTFTHAGTFQSVVGRAAVSAMQMSALRDEHRGATAADNARSVHARRLTEQLGYR